MLAAYRYRGRHRKPTATGRTAARVLTAGAVAVTPAVLTAPAQAAADSTWDRLAQCESGQRWSYDGPSGYDGGLQFSPRTWTAFGGGEFARYAHQASRGEQIAVAERVLAVQGWGAWPACSRKLGLRGEPANPRRTTVSAPAQTGSAPAEKPAEPPAAGGVYVVEAGDTLSGIAADHGTTWPALHATNTDVVEDPDRIWPGERLKV